MTDSIFSSTRATGSSTALPKTGLGPRRPDASFEESPFGQSDTGFQDLFGEMDEDLVGQMSQKFSTASKDDETSVQKHNQNANNKQETKQTRAGGGGHKSIFDHPDLPDNFDQLDTEVQNALINAIKNEKNKSTYQRLGESLSNDLLKSKSDQPTYVTFNIGYNGTLSTGVGGRGERGRYYVVSDNFELVQKGSYENIGLNIGESLDAGISAGLTLSHKVDGFGGDSHNINADVITLGKGEGDAVSFYLNLGPGPDYGYSRERTELNPDKETNPNE